MNDLLKRQLLIMQGLIEDHRAGRLALDTLIQRIEGVSNFVEIESWKDRIFPIILTLEQINAAVLNAKTTLSEVQRADVARALDDLEGLIQHAQKH
ncbi:MAG TPA: hypothetical protein VMT28_02135 [Terriglobales bacterium]|nr:hypothetical protein [Terriglobales bacterium]